MNTFALLTAPIKILQALWNAMEPLHMPPSIQQALRLGYRHLHITHVKEMGLLQIALDQHTAQSVGGLTLVTVAMQHTTATCPCSTPQHSTQM
jgi:hypothetical protein